jgi:predicted ATPase/serine/threonine protein kinase
MEYHEKHARLQELFLAASELPASKRAAFLDRECTGDLRADLDRLLAAHESETSLAGLVPAPPGPEDLVGTTLDGLYEIEALLGRGGMGTVYRARHMLLKDTVALKLLPREVSSDPAWLRRFMREGQAARRFRHPNAVGVHDLRATADGVAYLVLEYVEGRTLRTEMRGRSRLSAAAAVEVVEGVASALDAAHEAGVVHRDVKPENVMLATGGDGETIVKLLDLGVAKLLETREVPEASDATGVLTREGAMLGTPCYMSPEQWGSRQRDGKVDVDGRADVYALGVMTYELVCGTPPFRGDNWQELRHQHEKDQAQPAHERVPGLPEAFGLAIARAMAKDRADRFGTAGEFARALGTALTSGVDDDAETQMLGSDGETGAGGESTEAGAPATGGMALTTGDVDARTEANPATNLPEQLTSFVGRERDAEEVKRLLGEERLVTVAGPGGIGKTRLALQTAREALDRFPDGVWFVDFAPIADSKLVAPAIASTLGVRERPDVSVLEALCEYVREKRLLILLDNCEHLLEACGELAARLLRSCSHVRVLATSREELGVVGEAVWHAPPLDEEATVRLFAERARAGRQGFAVTDKNAAAVTELCRRLEGIPLAVELAAARIGVLMPAQMLARLAQRLDLLATRHADVPSRHRTLRASIEWSYNLLDQEERRAFAALSVFRGGWTLEAAERVARGPAGVAGPRATDVLDLLERLRTASLVVAEERGQEMRYRMLETLREFATERLEQEERGVLVRRHAEYFAQLAEQAEPHLEKADPEWVERLDAERDNVRAALERCGVGVVAAETGLRIVAASRNWWSIRGHLTEGRAAAAAALARCPEGPPALRAAVLSAAAKSCRNQSNNAAALAYEEEALALWRELGDRAGIAGSLQRLSTVAIGMLEYARAAALAEESLALARELGDRELIASGLFIRGTIDLNRGDHDAAIASFEEALVMFRAQGRREHIVMALQYLGDTRLARLEYDQAAALFEEGLDTARAGGFAMQSAVLTLNLGELKRYTGDYDRAEELCADALEQFHGLGATGFIALALHTLGSLSRAKGEYYRATERLRECLAISAEGGSQKYVADTIEELAGVAVATGRPERAARLLGAAEVLREAHSTPLTPADRPAVEATLATTRAALGDEAFDAALAAGRALTLDEAVAEALAR